MSDTGHVVKEEPTAADAPDALVIDVQPQYEERTYWLVLPINGYGDPKCLKGEPRNLTANEISLMLILQVPKARRRKTQAVIVKLPEETAHLRGIEVSTPDASS